MAKKLDPKAIEAARKKSSRAERRSQKKQIMQEDIVRNQGNGGVKIIPPPPLPVGENGERPKLRVAAYCRVSTQEEEQLGSFEMQVHHFQQRIEGNPAWELVKIYKDEGRSGTATAMCNVLAARSPWMAVQIICDAPTLEIVMTTPIFQNMQKSKRNRTIKALQRGGPFLNLLL